MPLKALDFESSVSRQFHHKGMEPMSGFEPLTYRLRGDCSAS